MRTDPQTRVPNASPMLRAVALPFFSSGVAALTYQLCWQRMLFSAFGVDLQSITVIVSVFMLGLGLGALAGGQLADKYPTRLVQMFGVAEVFIGLFGLASVWLIGTVAGLTASTSLLGVVLANFLLLLIPTTLMGATLPILVALLVRQTGNVGVSIGGLYFVNTLGAALGAALVGFVAFHYLDIRQTIQVAAVLNFIAAAIVFFLFGRKEAR